MPSCLKTQAASKFIGDLFPGETEGLDVPPRLWRSAPGERFVEAHSPKRHEGLKGKIPHHYQLCFRGQDVHVVHEAQCPHLGCVFHHVEVERPINHGH